MLTNVQQRNISVQLINMPIRMKKPSSDSKKDSHVNPLNIKLVEIHLFSECSDVTKCFKGSSFSELPEDLRTRRTSPVSFKPRVLRQYLGAVNILCQEVPRLFYRLFLIGLANEKALTRKGNDIDIPIFSRFAAYVSIRLCLSFLMIILPLVMKITMTSHHYTRIMLHHPKPNCFRPIHN